MEAPGISSHHIPEFDCMGYRVCGVMFHADIEEEMKSVLSIANFGLTLFTTRPRVKRSCTRRSTVTQIGSPGNSTMRTRTTSNFIERLTHEIILCVACMCECRDGAGMG